MGFTVSPCYIMTIQLQFFLFVFLKMQVNKIIKKKILTMATIFILYPLTNHFISTWYSQGVPNKMASMCSSITL